MTTHDTTRGDGKRFEYKYQLDTCEYYRVLSVLRPMARYDKYSLRAPHRRYIVRSLYYDTASYEAYEQKVTGVPNRIKLRIRSYECDRRMARSVKIEIKTRAGALVGKFSKPISLEEYEHFLSNRSWQEISDKVAVEFRRLTLLKDLRPKVLVDYHREAFVPISGGDVRITFDHAMRFALADELFPGHAFFQTARPQRVIMEIKTRKSRPRWLEQLCKFQQLKSVPNSKYAWAIEQTQQAIWHQR